MQFKVIIAIPAVIFFVVGTGMLLMPNFVSAQLGMTLLEGVGLSTQIGDLASFFLTLSSCILLAIALGKAFWLYPAIMLLGYAVLGRLVAWAFHGAAFAADMIAVEVVVIVLLYFAAMKLNNEQQVQP